MPSHIFYSRHFSSRLASETPPLPLLGQKVVGLASIPLDWTLPSLAIPANEDLHSASLAVALKEAIKSLIALHASTDVLVRSSAIDESLADRGHYQSKRCLCDAETVIRSSHDIRAHYSASLQGQNDNKCQGMALLIQPFVAATAFGHLSNERRVSRSASNWHVESQATEEQSPRVTRLRVARSRVESPLRCNSRDELPAVLRSIAAWCLGVPTRLHLEWIWDGRRVFVVQCDAEPEVLGQPPGSRWKGGGILPDDTVFNVLTPIHNANRRWPKVQAVRAFSECGLQTYPVFVLEHVKTLSQLARGKVPNALRADLKHLLVSPILIRTDLADDSGESGMLLRRSGALPDLERATSFLRERAQSLVADGRAADQFCFTIHQFVAASAGAYGYSKPGIPRVLIDANWGGPDSLLYYPHDTYVVDLTARKVLKKIRCKPEYLDMNAEGAWQEVKSGEPWDWKRVLDDERLFDIARQTRLVADHVGQDVEVMYFVDVRSTTGESYTLPWFYTDKVVSEFDPDTPVRYAGKRIAVMDRSDIQRLRREWEGERLRKPFSLSLRPGPELLRSEEFLTEVATFSRDVGVPIEFFGSVLAHYYYVLKRNGARILSIDAFREPRVSRKFGKLVRDKIPLRIESHGDTPRLMRVTSEQLLELLKAKAVEEALELFWEARDEKCIDELVDLLEVVESASTLCGTSLRHVELLAAAKREERGGFKEGIVLLETRSVPLLTDEFTGVGLFNDVEEAKPARHHRSRRNARVDVGATRRPRNDGDELVISLVPPSSTEGAKATLVPLSNDVYEARVRYFPCEVRIQFRRRDRQKHDPRQLVFTFLTEQSQ